MITAGYQVGSRGSVDEDDSIELDLARMHTYNSNEQRNRMIGVSKPPTVEIGGKMVKLHLSWPNGYVPEKVQSMSKAKFLALGPGDPNCDHVWEWTMIMKSNATLAWRFICVCEAVDPSRSNEPLRPEITNVGQNTHHEPDGLRRVRGYPTVEIDGD